MKKVSWLLVVAMLTALLAPSAALPVLADGTVNFSENFEGYQTGAFVGQTMPWGAASKEGCDMQILADGTNQVLKTSLGYLSAEQASNDSYIQSKAYDLSGKTILTYRIKLENASQGSMNLILRDTNSNAGLGSLNLMTLAGTEAKYLPEMLSAPVTETVDPTQWMTFQIVLDIANQTVTAYHNGVQKAQAVNIRSFSAKLQGYNFAQASVRFHLYVGKTVGRSISMLLDDIVIVTDYATDSSLSVTEFGVTKSIGAANRPLEALQPGNLQASARVKNLSGQAKSAVLRAALLRDGAIVQAEKSALTQIAAQDTASLQVPITVGELQGGETLQIQLFSDTACTTPLTLPATYTQSEFTRPFGEEIIADLKRTNPNQAHPRILVSKARLDELKTACKTDPTLSAWYARVKASADALAASTTYPSYDDADELRLSSAGTVQSNIVLCAFAYCMEGDAKYANRVYGEIQNAAAWPDWNPKHFLDTSAIIGGYAVAYDWLYDVWTEEQKELIRSKMIAYGLSEAQNAYNGVGVSDWWATTDNNWSMVCNGGVAMGALAIGDEAAYETLCGSLLETGLRRIEKNLAHFAPDGAWYEGPGYWNYTVEYLSMYFSSLLSATGTDYGYLDAPGLSKTGYFPIGMTGLSNTFNLHDAGESKISAPELFFLGSQYHDPTIASYRYYQLTSQNFTPEVKDILWYDPAMIRAISGLDTDFKFRDIEAATFRSSYFQPDSVYAGIHGGLNGINHGQIDAGNFIYEAQGVRWAVDLGGDNYNLYNYFNNSNTGKNRWAYYRNRGEGHNTVILNPGLTADQPLNQTAVLDSFSSTEQFGISTVNMQPIYGDYTASARRGMWLDKQVGGLLVQDELQFNQAGGNNLYWFMHTRASAELAADGKSAILTQNGKRLWVGILDDTHTFTVEDAVPLATSPDPNAWPENQANVGDSSNPKTQNANNGIRKLSIHDSNAGGNTTICVYMAPLTGTQTTPEQMPTLQPLAAWPQNTIGVRIAASDNLYQTETATGPVRFTASTLAAQEVDTAAIGWYVNGVKQPGAAGSTFSYTPNAAGEYTVYAQVGGDARTKSGTVTIHVAAEPGAQDYLLKDDFEGHGAAGTKLDASNVAPWSGTITDSRQFIKIAADPANAENHVAQYFNYNASGAGYPRLEKKEVAITASTPLVMRGKVRLKQMNSSFYLDLIKYIGGQKKTAGLMNFSANGQVRVAGQTVSGVNWSNDAWLWFSASLTPSDDLNSGLVRLCLSGDGTGGVYSVEKTVDLSSLNLSDSNLVTIYYNSSISYDTGSETGVDTGIYLDDAAVYNPQINTLSVMNSDPVPVHQSAQVPFRLHHDIDPATFDAAKVLVTAPDGSAVQPGSVAFDPMAPDSFTLHFAAETLQMGTVYHVALSGAVRDVAGRPVYGMPSFTTQSADPITSLAISVTAGQTEQPYDQMGPVVFAAQTVPAENVDVSTIEWYVNDEKQAGTGLAYTFTPAGAGSYTVTARTGLAVSNAITVTVSPGGLQTYLLADDFEGHGAAGTRLTASNMAPWDSVANNQKEFVYIAADPEDASNKAAQLYNNNESGAGWPRLEKRNLTLKPGTPLVLSGRVRIREAGSTYYPQFVKQIGDVRKTVNFLEMTSNGTIKVGGAAVNNAVWTNGAWVRYNLCITPDQTMTGATVRATLTGAVTGGMVTAQSNLDLSSLELGSDSRVMIYFNTYVGTNTGAYAGADTGIYFDDILLYEPVQTQMTAVQAGPVAIYEANEITVQFNNEIDPATFDAASVRVADAAGKQVAPSAVAFDPSRPTEFRVAFYEAALEAGKTYSITLDSSVKNMAGDSITGAATFSTRQQSYVLTDDFETGHGSVGQVFDASHCAPWSWAACAETEFVKLAADPLDADNLVAQFGYDTTLSKYPRVQKNSIPFTPGQPVVLSGRMLLKNTTSTFYMELVNGSRVAVFDLSTAGRVLAGKDKAQVANVSWQPGTWVTFQVRIDPAQDAALSQMELVLHGGVSGGVLRVQKTLDLSSIGTAQPLNVYFNSMLSKGNNDENYLDDMKIYLLDPAVE